jgi:hypothetical protein
MSLGQLQHFIFGIPFMPYWLGVVLYIGTVVFVFGLFIGFGIAVYRLCCMGIAAVFRLGLFTAGYLGSLIALCLHAALRLRIFLTTMFEKAPSKRRVDEATPLLAYEQKRLEHWKPETLKVDGILH